MRYASFPKPVLSKFAKRNGFAGMHSIADTLTIKIEQARRLIIGLSFWKYEIESASYVPVGTSQNSSPAYNKNYWGTQYGKGELF